MAIVKRLCIAVAALAFVVALTTQAVLPAWAMPVGPSAMQASATGMSAHPDGPVAPCKRATPTCVEHIGCVNVFAISASSARTGVLIQWREVRYDLAVSRLTGLSVAPELSPPILAI